MGELDRLPIMDGDFGGACPEGVACCIGDESLTGECMGDEFLTGENCRTFGDFATGDIDRAGLRRGLRRGP